MAGTLVKRVLMQISADDMDAEEKLDAIAAKADELGQKHPELKVKIDSAAAAAKMRVLREELKSAATVQAQVETGEAEVSVNWLTAQIEVLAHDAERIKIKADDTGAEITLLRLRAKLADLSEKTADPHIRVSGALRAQADIAAVRLELDKLSASGVRVGLMQRLLGGLGNRFSLAGFGGNFKGGLLNMVQKIPFVPGEGGAPAEGLGGLAGLGGGIGGIVSAIGAALVELDGLISGFAAAGAGAGAFGLLALPAIRHVSGAMTKISADQQAYSNALTATGRSNALKKLHRDWNALTPDEKRAVDGIGSLRKEYGKLSKAFEPEAYKIFSDFLKLANTLLPDITPFAKTFADSLHGLLGEADRFAGSKGFTDWLKQFHKLEGPSITAIGTGLGHVLTSVGKLFTIMSTKDVVNSINIAFSVIDGAIIGIGGAIKIAMWSWDHMTTHFDEARHAIGHSFDVVRHDAARMGHDVAHDFDTMRHDAARVAHDVAHDFDSVRHSVAQLGHGIAVDFDAIRHNLAHWADDVRTDTDRVTGWFRALPGRILAILKDAGTLLYDTGRNIVSGLVNGIKSAAGSVLSAIQSLGGGLVSKAMSVLGIHSPSKVFMTIGEQITQGLALGLHLSGPRAVAEAQRLANRVANAAAAGSIGAVQAAQLRAQLAAATVAAVRSADQSLLGGAAGELTGTRAHIGHESLALLRMTWNAADSGIITRGQASGIAVWLKKDNTRLQALSVERAGIMKKIAAAQAYATKVTASTESAYGLTSAAGSGPAPASVRSIIGTLGGDVTQIRQFAANIRKLAKMGLNRAYIDQLIQAGPVAAGPLAAELAGANLGEIHRINRAESQIASTSAQLGRTAANAMYDSGDMAGRGLLSGLKAQEAAITKMMDKLADSMVNELKRKLGIHSPSVVMREHGLAVGKGLELGISDSIPAVTASAQRMAGAVTGAAYGHPAYAGAHGAPLRIELEVVGNSNDILFTLLKKNIRIRGGDPAVLGR